jgi:hypothetical protein
MGVLRKAWVLLPFALGAIPAARLHPPTETLRTMADRRFALRVRVTTVPVRWQEYRATVVETVKGDAAPGSKVQIETCCDLDWAPGEELLVLSDRFPRLRLCGQEGGWPAVRRVTAGSVRWDAPGSPKVPLWLFRVLAPAGGRRTAPESGG